MSSIQERVARGAMWLDSTHPGWRDQISLDTFTIASCERCVIGQVLGDFPLVYQHMNSAAAQNFGFMWEVTERPEDARPEILALTTEWRRVIHGSRVLARIESGVSA